MSMLKRFVERFPEFDAADEKLLAYALSEARSEVDLKTWGKKYRSGIYFLAAHKLACSPFGEPARLQPDDDKTIYLKEYERMLKSLAFGFQVI